MAQRSGASPIRTVRPGLGAISLGAAFLVALTGRTSTKDSSGSGSGGAAITIGTTDQVPSFDPAGAGDEDPRTSSSSTTPTAAT